jgi:hypothetical protein
MIYCKINTIHTTEERISYILFSWVANWSNPKGSEGGVISQNRDPSVRRAQRCWEFFLPEAEGWWWLSLFCVESQLLNANLPPRPSVAVIQYWYSIREHLFTQLCKDMCFVPVHCNSSS